MSLAVGPRTPEPTGIVPDLDEYRAECAEWLSGRWPQRDDVVLAWGKGTDDVSIFHSLSHERELELLERGSRWQAEKVDAGYGAIAWPRDLGGSGLSVDHELVYRGEEARYDVPASHELLRITVNLVAPTVRSVGTTWQRERFLGPFLRCEELVCQLFSEPGAGSDLASAATRATRDGDSWVISGSKVWVSGAQFAAWGLLLARTTPDAPKHQQLSAFLVPTGTDGMDVRPIRQMSGGTSFNEVFLTDVRVDDALRLGEIGAGWAVARAMLGFERAQSGSKKGVGGSWEQLLALARWLGENDDPVIRQRLAAVYSHERLRELTRARAVEAARTSDVPGAEGSLGKLLWVQGMLAIGDVAATMLGARLTADTQEWGCHSWVDHVLGAPGFRIAGGTDEIQRNIIAERVLKLPRDAG